MRGFPRLLPYFLAFQAVLFLLEWLLILIFSGFPSPVTLMGQALSIVVVCVLSSLLILGFFRLCLDRMEGRRGRAPWAMLAEWKEHKSYLFWAGVFPGLWRMGKILTRIWLGDRLTDVEMSRFSEGMACFNVFLSLFSLLFLMLLVSAVRTAYLSREGGGFWQAVGRGLGRCVRTWSQCIGYQLKFVVSVQAAVFLLKLLLTNMLSGGPVPGETGLRTVFGWVVTCYDIVVLASLAAERYGPPEERT